MSSESEQEAAIKEKVRLDAEQFTSLAKEFLKRLGYKRNLRPKKATLEGDRYIVEVELKNKTAKVQIHTKTNEIREFEIEERVGETGFSLSKKTLLLILGISASVIVVIVLKFRGLLPF
jgi:restriction endonuclease Mrr